ncbi:protein DETOXIFICATION 33 [Cinnamomum micranthum f. kanehirae]|uniref:Protein DETOXIFICATION 33 n=1 Tax=Cinnamomum micranthum f. kanehirae TaxID=337451 RepID=A0A3S3NIA9_9MAGN|nr:protein DETOXIFICATION 33 [Cinnamomum micranthum f. kanehirae]
MECDKAQTEKSLWKSNLYFAMEAPLLLQEPQNTNFFSEAALESKKLWKIAGPVIFTAICQYSLWCHHSDLRRACGYTRACRRFGRELSRRRIRLRHNVRDGKCFGDTVWASIRCRKTEDDECVHMERSWIILLCTALVLVPIYMFSPPILKLMGETSEISDLARKFAVWMLPQLFAYALNFPIQKFLQAQRKVMVMAVVAGVVLVIHVVLSWLLILKLKWGLVGADVTLDLSWWLVVIGKLGYIFAGACGQAWSHLEWIFMACLSRSISVCHALHSLCCYVMLRVMVSQNPSSPHRSPEEPCYSSRRDIHLYELEWMGCNDCNWIQCCHKVIWGGLIGGLVLQTMILFATTAWTNWKKEAAQSESRIKKWGGSVGEE